MEFQKAQCLFMMAINIAALINRNKGGFQPNSLQQLYNTYGLIKSISISGYLPVTFTLFTLHLVDVVSWYLLVLSVITVSVSVATLFVIGKFSPSQDDLDYLSQQALSGGPDSCGNKNLFVYCLNPIGGSEDSDSANPASGAYSMLAFCVVVLILLVAHQYHAFKDPLTGQPQPWLSKILRCLFRKYNHSLRKIQLGLALISICLNSYGAFTHLLSYSIRSALILNNVAISDQGVIYDDSYSAMGSATPAAPAFAIFASCWTLTFVLYVFFTSTTAYTRTDRPIGKFFNQKMAFAVDALSTVIWFAEFITLARFFQNLGYCNFIEESYCGTAITSVLVGVCAWYDCCLALTLRDGY